MGIEKAIINPIIDQSEAAKRKTFEKIRDEALAKGLKNRRRKTKMQGGTGSPKHKLTKADYLSIEAD